MPQPGETTTGPDGKLRVWQPDTRNSDNFDYLGPASGFSSAEEAHQADLDSGQGSYVPASNVTHWPWWLKAFVATGLGSAAVTGIGALAAPGAFGLGGAGAAGAGGAAGGAAGAGTAGAGAGVGAGAAGGALPTIPLSTTLGTLPSVGLGASVPTSLGVGAAPTSTLLGSTPSYGLGAAPHGAGTIGTLGKLSTLGQTLSSYSQGAATGREHEAILNLNADQLRQRQAESERQNALDRGKLEVDQRTTGQDLESQARRQAAWAALMKAGPARITPPANLAPFTMTHTGGMPSQEDLTQLGTQGYDAAIKRLLSGSDKQFAPQPNIPTPPITPQPNESWLDKLMRWGGTGAGVAGSFSNYRAPTGRT